MEEPPKNSSHKVGGEGGGGESGSCHLVPRNRDSVGAAGFRFRINDKLARVADDLSSDGMYIIVRENEPKLEVSLNELLTRVSEWYSQKDEQSKLYLKGYMQDVYGTLYSAIMEREQQQNKMDVKDGHSDDVAKNAGVGAGACSMHADARGVAVASSSPTTTIPVVAPNVLPVVVPPHGMQESTPSMIGIPQPEPATKRGVSVPPSIEGEHLEVVAGESAGEHLELSSSAHTSTSSGLPSVAPPIISSVHRTAWPAPSQPNPVPVTQPVVALSTVPLSHVVPTPPPASVPGGPSITEPTAPVSPVVQSSSATPAAPSQLNLAPVSQPIVAVSTVPSTSSNLVPRPPVQRQSSAPKQKPPPPPPPPPHKTPTSTPVSVAQQSASQTSSTQKQPFVRSTSSGLPVTRKIPPPPPGSPPSSRPHKSIPSSHGSTLAGAAAGPAGATAAAPQASKGRTDVADLLDNNATFSDLELGGGGGTSDKERSSHPEASKTHASADVRREKQHDKKNKNIDSSESSDEETESDASSGASAIKTSGARKSKSKGARESTRSTLKSKSTKSVRGDSGNSAKKRSVEKVKHKKTSRSSSSGKDTMVDADSGQDSSGSVSSKIGSSKKKNSASTGHKRDSNGGEKSHTQKKKKQAKVASDDDDTDSDYEEKTSLNGKQTARSPAGPRISSVARSANDRAAISKSASKSAREDRESSADSASESSDDSASESDGGVGAKRKRNDGGAAHNNKKSKSSPPSKHGNAGKGKGKAPNERREGASANGSAKRSRTVDEEQEFGESLTPAHKPIKEFEKYGLEWLYVDCPIETEYDSDDWHHCKVTAIDKYNVKFRYLKGKKTYTTGLNIGIDDNHLLIAEPEAHLSGWEQYM